MTTSEIGNIGQSAIITEFVRFGVNVYTPFGDGYRVDLIAEWNNKLYKIQVKTCEKVLDESCMNWRLTRQEGYHGNKKTYNENEVDYFALYCIETKTCYLVPFSDVSELTDFRIRLDSYPGIRKKGMHFEQDYKFEKYIIRESS